MGVPPLFCLCVCRAWLKKCNWLMVEKSMVWPNFKKESPSEPSAYQLQKEAAKDDLYREENNSTNAEMQAAGGIAFDFQVIDDEKILGLFDPKHPLYCEHLMPLLPLFSRMNFLTNCSLLEAAAYKQKVDIAITQLKNQIKITIDDVSERTKIYMLLENLLAYANMRINDSIQGFKLVQLTERTKNIKLTEVPAEQPHKRGLFG